MAKGLLFVRRTKHQHTAQGVTANLGQASSTQRLLGNGAKVCPHVRDQIPFCLFPVTYKLTSFKKSAANSHSPSSTFVWGIFSFTKSLLKSSLKRLNSTLENLAAGVKPSIKNAQTIRGLCVSWANYHKHQKPGPLPLASARGSYQMKQCTLLHLRIIGVNTIYPVFLLWPLASNM